MKKLLPSTMLILSIIMFGCSNKPEILRYMGINGQASQITEFLYQEKDELGKILTSEPTRVHIYDFNDMGRLVKSSFSSSYSGFESEMTIIYEGDKCVLSTNKVLVTTTSRGITTQEYKTTIRNFIETKNGIEKWAVESTDDDQGVFQYDERKGNLTTTSKEDSEGLVKPLYETKTNRMGYIVEWTFYRGDGTLTYFNEYDFRNQLISQKSRSEHLREPEPIHEYLSIYKYTKHDEKENWIERVEYQDDKPYEIVKREIQYK